MKIINGIVSFFIGGFLTVLIFRPILASFIPNETILDVLHIAINIIIAVQIYKLGKKLFNNDLKTKRQP
ncbi:hypothetical protein [Tenacibaculum geojense]|uniref:Uncharacterized protein n=1 Tax=Tenacibaculum geojense TaxID=915352 RepID=A0ABW3JRH1_9FLAO